MRQKATTVTTAAKKMVTGGLAATVCAVVAGEVQKFNKRHIITKAFALFTC
jgi:hypothetical protein